MTDIPMCLDLYADAAKEALRDSVMTRQEFQAQVEVAGEFTKMKSEAAQVWLLSMLAHLNTSAAFFDAAEQRLPRVALQLLRYDLNASVKYSTDVVQSIVGRTGAQEVAAAAEIAQADFEHLRSVVEAWGEFIDKVEGWRDVRLLREVDDKFIKVVNDFEKWTPPPRPKPDENGRY